MAYKYNYGAQRSDDIIVEPTSKTSGKTPLIRQEVALIHGEPVPRDKPKIAPRVIRIPFDSSLAEIYEDRLVWNVNFRDLAANTMVYLSEIASNQLDQVDFGLLGLNTWTYALSGPQYFLRSRFVAAQSNTTASVFSADAGNPPGAMIRDADALRNARITLQRIGSSGTSFLNIGSFFLRFTLVFVEPGAAYIYSN